MAGMALAAWSNPWALVLLGAAGCKGFLVKEMKDFSPVIDNVNVAFLEHSDDLVSFFPRVYLVPANSHQGWRYTTGCALQTRLRRGF